MKKNLIKGLVIILLSMCVFSCQEESVTPKSNCIIRYNIPSELSDLTISEIVITIENKNTGTKQTQSYQDEMEIVLDEGIYSIIMEANAEYSTEGIGENKIIQKSKLRGIKESVSITGKNVVQTIDLFLKIDSKGFVFEEIFFSGTVTPKGSQYNSDKFFEIYNNTNEILYADGLCISETAFLTTMKNDYTPNIMNEYVTVDAIYTIPGSGKEYPVLPGKSILVVDIAKNHKETNTNSFDLSIADFEWFDDDKFGIDVDIPSVPNLIKTYSSSKSVWSLHNRGFKSYIIFKIDKPIDEFLLNNKYNYSYDFVWAGGSVNMASSNYKVPNSLIIDAVECSAPSLFEWLVMSPSLDMGYTHSGDANAERVGKSVRRKISHKESDGRVVLMDTNNSSFDFIPTANPTPGDYK